MKKRGRALSVLSLSSLGLRQFPFQTVVQLESRRMTELPRDLSFLITCGDTGRAPGCLTYEVLPQNRAVGPAKGLTNLRQTRLLLHGYQAATGTTVPDPAGISSQDLAAGSHDNAGSVRKFNKA